MTRLYRSITRQSLHYFARPHQRVPDQPQPGAAAWFGEDLRARPDLWEHRFSADQCAELDAALAHAAATGKATEDLTAADFPLPTLRPQLLAWRDEVQRGRGFVLLRGLPVDRWSQSDSERVFWCLGWHLGLPGAQNRQGDLLGHVRDTGQDPGDWRVREYATSVGISFHCDAADAVGLMCLATAREGGASRIASSVTVFNEMLRTRPDLVGRLFEPIELDARGEGGLQHFPIAPARYDAGQLRTFYHSGYFRSAPRYDGVPPLDARTLAALDAFDALTADPRIHLDMELAPGDIQLCSNHTIVHSRTAYVDHDEPERRRHLLRLWLSLPQRESLASKWRRLHATAGLLGMLARERWRQRHAFSA